MIQTTRARSAGIGVLASGVATYAFVRGQFGQPRLSDLLAVLVLSPLIAGLTAGIVVGLTTESSRDALMDGGLAAVVGTIAGFLGYATAAVIAATTAPLAHRLDIYFVILSYIGLPLMAVGPVIFLVGGFVASRLARHRQSVREPSLSEFPRDEE